jgi:uncharacterized membrane protein
MGPEAIIGIWAALFIASHLILSSARVRPPLVKRVGQIGFRGLYSIMAFATLIPLIVEFARHKHTGAMLWYLRADPPLRWLAWIMMLAALVFFVGAFVTPNPGTIGAPSDTNVHGILKLTRHPSFVGFILFGVAHILMNGWLGDVIFFGTFCVLGVVGGVRQDRRKIREMGEPYRRFVEQTSFVPGAAILNGHQSWSYADTPLIAIVAGGALTIVILIFHPHLFGGRPLG